MTWWDFALQRQCVGGRCHEASHTPAKYATSLILDHVSQVLKCVRTDICIDSGALTQEVHKQNAFSVPKQCAHDLPSWSGLLEFHLCWRWSVPTLHELLLQFSGLMRHHLVPCDYTDQEVFTFLTVLCQKVCCFNLCSSVSIFGTQRAHNFRNLSLSDTISWRSDREIWRKCRKSDVMVNCLVSLIFSSTLHTKSSFTTDSRPLRRSSCTFSCLN